MRWPSTSLDAAVAALRSCSTADAGRAALLVGGARTCGNGRPRGRRRPAAARRGRRRLGGGPGAGPGARVAAPGAAPGAARRRGRGRPGRRAHRRRCRLHGRHRRRRRARGRAGSGGSGAGASALDVQAAVDEAAAARDGVEEELARLRPALEGARAEEAARLADLDAAREARTAAERRAGAAAAQLGRLEQAVRSAGAEAERLRARRDAVEASAPTRCSRWRPPSSGSRSPRTSPSTTSRTPGSGTPPRTPWPARAPAEVEARLALRTAEERARAIAGRAESLRRQASAERQARARAAAARAARERGARIAGIVVSAGETALRRHRRSLAAAAVERDAAARRPGRAGARAGRGAHHHEPARPRCWRSSSTPCTGTRCCARSRGRGSRRSRQGARRPRPRRGRPRRRVRAARARAGVGGGDGGVRGGPRARGRRGGAPAHALRPRRPSSAGPPGRRRTSALLGRVNPLALEEFAALEERYRFLSTQLEDLKNTRRDLLTVVREVDDKILAGVHRGVHGRRARVRDGVRHAVPRRRGPAGPHRPRRTC